MLTRKIYKTFVGCVFIFTGTQVFADTNTAMKKDEWLNNLKTIAPAIICKGFFEDANLKQRLEELQINQDKCLALIPPSYDKCQAKYYSQLPENIDQSNGTKWGRAIGECIGADFMLNNMSPSSSQNANQPSSTTSTSTPSQNTTSPAGTQAPSTPASESQGTNTSPPAQTSNTSNTINKDKWLSDLKASAPELICKGFLDDAFLKVKFQEKGIDMKQCVAMLPDSFDKCKMDLYGQLPDTLTNEDTSKWGYKIGECIGGDFVKKHILGNQSSGRTQ